MATRQTSGRREGHHEPPPPGTVPYVYEEPHPRLGWREFRAVDEQGVPFLSMGKVSDEYDDVDKAFLLEAVKRFVARRSLPRRTGLALIHGGDNGDA